MTGASRPTTSSAWVSSTPPFRIEDEARDLKDTNFIVQGPYTAHAVRDGNLITGQQQASASATARLAIEALGK